MNYIALLRGINVGGNNKVAMSELRGCFEAAGLTAVSTYINSGNVLFSSEIRDEVRLVQLCETAIERQFGFAIVVMVIAADELQMAIDHAPKWWADGTKDVRHDALFVIPPTTAQEVLGELGKKSSTVDKLTSYGQVVFWSLPKREYNKSVVPKIIGTPIYRRITIRSSTTTKKLYELTKGAASGTV